MEPADTATVMFWHFIIRQVSLSNEKHNNPLPSQQV